MAKLFDQDAPTFVDPTAIQRWPDLERRLYAVGATVAEVADFMDAWFHDPTFTFEDKERIWAMGDGHLRAELVHVREVNRHNLETGEQSELRQQIALAEHDAAALRAQALEMSAYDENAIVRWVGHDTHRARALLAVEEQHPRPRAELVEALREMIG